VLIESPGGGWEENRLLPDLATLGSVLISTEGVEGAAEVEGGSG
jgi:hypothetical protein